MTTIQSQSTSNACSISQWAAVEALNGPQDYIAEAAAAFRRRRDLVVGAAERLPRHRPARSPEGAFYVYPSIAGLIGRAHARGRPHRHATRTSPPRCSPPRGWRWSSAPPSASSPNFRISYAAADEVLADACRPHPPLLRKPRLNGEDRAVRRGLLRSVGGRRLVVAGAPARSGRSRLGRGRLGRRRGRGRLGGRGAAGSGAAGVAARSRRRRRGGGGSGSSPPMNSRSPGPPRSPR